MSVSSATTLISPSNGVAPPSTSAATGAGGVSASTAGSGAHANPPRRRQSTHSAGHGHSAHSAHGHGHSAHSSRRTTHTAHSTHGHGHSHSHSSHSASHRGTRRSSEGESGRRALAAGLTMAALDAVQAATSGGAAGASASGGANAGGASASTTGGLTTGTGGSGSDKDPRERERKTKRKAGEHHAHHTHHAHHAHGTRAHIPKTSRSETHLPRLSRTPSSGGVSALTSESSQTGHSCRPGGSRSRTRSEEATVQVEVVSGDGAEDAGDAAAGDEGEWESGEETPGVGSRRRRSVVAEVVHHQRRGSERKVSNAESHVSAMSAAAEDDPLELGSQHSPGHEPPATRKTTGFGATSHTSIPSEAAAAEAETAASSSIAAAAPVVDGAIAETPLSSAELPSENSGDTAPTSSSTAPHLTSEMTEPTVPGTGFPFPRMYSDGAVATEASMPNHHHLQRDPSVSYASAVSESPAQVSQLGASQATTQSTRSRVTSSASRSLATSGGAHTSTTLRRPGSQQSLRSIQSLRAAPHPLNSPTGRSGFLHMNSPKEKRVSSLHYPPAAPAVVYKETVGGQGWDEEGAEAAHPRRPQETPPAAAPQPRTERVGSFSSVRSLKDLLAGNVGGTNPVPSTRAVTRGVSGAGTPGRDPSRRMTAMQAASAVARLNTTSDPVAYHQSLGFSPQTAETAHLLSRFLPTHRAHRPKWTISTREAMSVMEAAAAGEEPECRVGLTDGQYRDAHESLVTTLREFGKPPAGTVGRRGAGHGGAGSAGGSIGAAARNYSYHNLLGAVEQVGPHSRGTGQTPFELSVARCAAQRPKQLAMF